MKLHMSIQSQLRHLTQFAALHVAMVLAIAATGTASVFGQPCEPHPHTLPAPPVGANIWDVVWNEEGGDEGRIAVIVNFALYDTHPEVRTAIRSYAHALNLEGHDVVVVSFKGDAEYLRGQIQQELYGPSPSLTGAVLVGDVPYIIYEEGSSNYPADAFFMDMTGSWYDLDSDGFYDSWDDNQVEIWVSRIKADNLPGICVPDPPGTSMPEHEIIVHYFERNDALRHDVFAPSNTALVYDRDDQQQYPYYWRAALDALSNAFDSESDKIDVVCGIDAFKTDYLSRLGRTQQEEPYHYIHEHSDGWIWGHAFDEGLDQLIYGMDYLDKDPKVIGFSLMSCATCDFTHIPDPQDPDPDYRRDYLGGDVAFNPEGDALVVFGYSSVIDYTLDQTALWSQLGAGRCFGEGYKALFNRHPELVMVLLGDGSLKADSHHWEGGGIPPYSWDNPRNWEGELPPGEYDHVRIGGAAVNPVQVDVGTPEAPERVWSVALRGGADLEFMSDHWLRLSGSLLAEPMPPEAVSTVTMHERTTLELAGTGTHLSHVNLVMDDNPPGTTTNLKVGALIDQCGAQVGHNCTVDIDTGRIDGSVFGPVDGTVEADSIRGSQFVVGTDGSVTAGEANGCGFWVGTNALVAATERITGWVPSGHEQDWTIDHGFVDAGPSTLWGDWTISGVAAGHEWSVLFDQASAAGPGMSMTLQNGARVEIEQSPSDLRLFPSSLPGSELHYELVCGPEANVLKAGQAAADYTDWLYFGDYTRMRALSEESALTLRLQAELRIRSDFEHEFVRGGWDSRGVDIAARPIWASQPQSDPDVPGEPPCVEQASEMISPDLGDWSKGNELVFLDVPCHGAFRDLILPYWDPASPGDPEPLRVVMRDYYDNSPASGAGEVAYYRNVCIGANRTLEVLTTGVIHYWDHVEMHPSANVYVDGVGVDTYVPATTIVVPTHYGDWNGDCVISNAEFGSLRQAIAGGPQTYDPLMDCDCNGTLSPKVELPKFLANMQQQPPCGPTGTSTCPDMEGDGGDGGGEAGGGGAAADGDGGGPGGEAPGAGGGAAGDEADGGAAPEGDGGATDGGAAEDPWASYEYYDDVPGLAAWLTEVLPADELAAFSDGLAVTVVEFADTPLGADLAELLCYLQ